MHGISNISKLILVRKMLFHNIQNKSKNSYKLDHMIEVFNAIKNAVFQQFQ